MIIFIYVNINQRELKILGGNMKFETKSIHGIQKYDKESGGIGTPINLSSTFQIFEFGKEQEFEYSRVSNPTRSELEKLIAKLENGKKGYAFSSGMAAINAVFAMFKAGDHIVTCDDIYGGTYRLITEVFQNFGIEFTFVDATDLNAVKSAIKENTKAIFIEIYIQDEGLLSADSYYRRRWQGVAKILLHKFSTYR